MLTTDFAELAAVRGAFCLLVARWRLTQGELRMLLPVVDAPPAGRILPDDLSSSGETRVRLLLRLDDALARICDGGDVGGLLRDRDGGAAATPLEELADLAMLRATVTVAEDAQRLRAGAGGAR